MQLLRHVQPDVFVHLGDLMDYDALNSNSPRKHTTLALEFEAAGLVLAQLRKAAGPAKLVYMDGNHEDRRTCAPKELLDLLDFERNEKMKRELHHWNRVDNYLAPSPNDRHACNLVRFGQVTLSHGFKWGANADRHEAALYGVEYGLHIRSHTHQPLAPTRVMYTPTIPMNRWAANVGCGADLHTLKLHYAGRRNTSMWGHGAIIFQFNPEIKLADKRHWEAYLVDFDER